MSCSDTHMSSTHKGRGVLVPAAASAVSVLHGCWNASQVQNSVTSGICRLFLFHNPLQEMSTSPSNVPARLCASSWYPPMTPKVQASASISKNQWLTLKWHIHFVQEWNLACLPDNKLVPCFWWNGRRVEERPLLHLDVRRPVQIVPGSWFHLLSLMLCASYGKTWNTLSKAVCAALQ